MQAENMTKASRSVSQANPTYVAILLPRQVLLRALLMVTWLTLKLTQVVPSQELQWHLWNAEGKELPALWQKHRNPCCVTSAHLGRKSLVFCKLVFCRLGKAHEVMKHRPKKASWREMCQRSHSQHAAIYTASVGNMNHTGEMRTEIISAFHSAPLPEITAFILVLTELVFSSLPSASMAEGKFTFLGSLSKPLDCAFQLL